MGAEAGVWSVDIPWQLYEEPVDVYVWRKKFDARITADDVLVTRESDDPRDYARYRGGRHGTT